MALGKSTLPVVCFPHMSASCTKEGCSTSGNAGPVRTLALTGDDVHVSRRPLPDASADGGVADGPPIQP